MYIVDGHQVDEATFLADEWLDLWHQNPDRIDAAIDDDLRQGDQP